MKKNEKALYKIMNTVFLLVAVLFLGGVIRETITSGIRIEQTGQAAVLSVLACLCCFLILHGAKCLRFYLVLMEQKIQFPRFVRIYLKTTFVNFLLPIKSGELFRIYCFAHETKNVQMGFISVILDRVFDTCILLLFLLPYDVFVAGRISVVTILLGLIVLVAVLGSVFLYSSYGYLNRFLIINGSSKRTIVLLQLLENFKVCYDYMAKLLKGRFVLIFLFSCIGWVFEFLFLKFMAGIMNISFNATQFAEYICGIFESSTGMVKNEYVLISAVGLLISLAIAYGLKNRRSENA